MKRTGVAVGFIFLFVGAGIVPAIAQNTDKPLPASKDPWSSVGGSGSGTYATIQDSSVSVF